MQCVENIEYVHLLRFSNKYYDVYHNNENYHIKFSNDENKDILELIFILFKYQSVENNCIVTSFGDMVNELHQFDHKSKIVLELNGISALLLPIILSHLSESQKDLISEIRSHNGIFMPQISEYFKHNSFEVNFTRDAFHITTMFTAKEIMFTTLKNNHSIHNLIDHAMIEYVNKLFDHRDLSTVKLFMSPFEFRKYIKQPLLMADKNFYFNTVRITKNES